MNFKNPPKNNNNTPNWAIALKALSVHVTFCNSKKDIIQKFTDSSANICIILNYANGDDSKRTDYMMDLLFD